MTATVKHISVHPNYRRCRVVGIFDDLDKKPDPRKARIDRHVANKQAAGQRETQNVARNSFAYYSPNFQYVKHDPFPEGHGLHGLDLDAILNLPDDPQ